MCSACYCTGSMFPCSCLLVPLYLALQVSLTDFQVRFSSFVLRLLLKSFLFQLSHFISFTKSWTSYACKTGYNVQTLFLLLISTAFQGGIMREEYSQEHGSSVLFYLENIYLQYLQILSPILHPQMIPGGFS